ncbi:peptidoglycan-binding protein LysM [Streptomyces sp. NPDC051109]|uniref:peptidoglycan-binding protein LysM n=1 Tax=Streptomyces sp. NPDC051109 TaxID=3365642 RepID=UPI00378DBBBE
MTLHSFVREAGEKLVGFLDPGNAEAEAQLKQHIEAVGLGSPNIGASVEGDKVVLKGEVASQEEAEKLVLVTGNIHGVANVEDQLTVTGPTTAVSRFTTVRKGDTLPSIAKAQYGDANRYNWIFEANKPMLSHPDRIYPGMVLRLPN